MSYVAEVLSEIGLTGPVSVVAELGGGAASQSFLIMNGDDKLVLRIDTPLAKSIGFDRQAEVDILGLVSAEGLGPALVWADASRGLMLTAYIEGRAWNDTDISISNNLRRLAKLLKRLHSLPAAGRDFRVLDWASHYSGQLGTNYARNLVAKIGTLNESLMSSAVKPVLCHNDPLAANIVDNGTLHFIDWEYSGVGSPFFDLAVVVAHHELDPRASSALLDSYFGGGYQEHEDSLRHACELYDCLHLLWLMLVEANGELASEQHDCLIMLESKVCVPAN
jgi:thiamine kinase